METSATDSIDSAWRLFERVEPGDRIHQGDLIRFEDAEPLRKYGIVVTADCDLEHRKHGQLITLVPLVSLRVVLEHYLLFEVLDRQRDKLTDLLGEELGFQGSLDDPIAVADLRIRLKERELGEQNLGGLSAQVLLNDLDQIEVADFRRLMKAIGVSTANLHDRVGNQVRSKGDLVLLPHPQFIREDHLDFAWVRPIWQVPVRNVTLKTSESGQGFGERIARLDSPYRYRVTQVMAHVFTDIGVPDVRRDFINELQGILK
jgi:hypothetical protein